MKNKSSAGFQHGGCVCDDARTTSGDIHRRCLSAVAKRLQSACRQHAVSALQHGHAGADVHESARRRGVAVSISAVPSNHQRSAGEFTSELEPSPDGPDLLLVCRHEEHRSRVSGKSRFYHFLCRITCFTL